MTSCSSVSVGAIFTRLKVADSVSVVDTVATVTESQSSSVKRLSPECKKRVTKSVACLPECRSPRDGVGAFVMLPVIA
jgi:hypothetical protein